MCVEESLTVPRQVSDGDAGMEGLLVELLAVPQLRFLPQFQPASCS